MLSKRNPRRAREGNPGHQGAGLFDVRIASFRGHQAADQRRAVAIDAVAQRLPPDLGRAVFEEVAKNQDRKGRYWRSIPVLAGKLPGRKHGKTASPNAVRAARDRLVAAGELGIEAADKPRFQNKRLGKRCKGNPDGPQLWARRPRRLEVLSDEVRRAHELSQQIKEAVGRSQAAEKRSPEALTAAELLARRRGDELPSVRRASPEALTAAEIWARQRAGERGPP